MEKCWKGYEKKGMKTMFGKRYPNCVKKEETQLEDSRLTSSNDMQSKMYADKNKSGKKMSDDEIKKEKGGKEFLARIKAAKEKMKKEETELEKLQKAIKTGMMNGAKLTPEQIQGLKAGLTQGGNKVDEGVIDTIKDVGKKVKEFINKPIISPTINQKDYQKRHDKIKKHKTEIICYPGTRIHHFLRSPWKRSTKLRIYFRKFWNDPNEHCQNHTS